MTQPINLIFRFLQNKSRIQVWLYEQVNTRIEGRIIGFDEYMNLVVRAARLCSSRRGHTRCGRGPTQRPPPGRASAERRVPRHGLVDCAP